MIFERINWVTRKKSYHTARFTVRYFAYIKENRDRPVCNEKPANNHLSKST
jgi:hypothetical protein